MHVDAVERLGVAVIAADPIAAERAMSELLGLTRTHLEQVLNNVEETPCAH